MWRPAGSRRGGMLGSAARVSPKPVSCIVAKDALGTREAVLRSSNYVHWPIQVALVRTARLGRAHLCKWCGVLCSACRLVQLERPRLCCLL